MVASSVNYVEVEKISWKHDNSTVAGGKALADLVLADGTKVAGATIASVNNAVTTSHNTGAVTITKGKTATIAGFTNTVVANTDTMFLVMDKDSNGNYTYYKNCCCKLTIRLYR